MSIDHHDATSKARSLLAFAVIAGLGTLTTAYNIALLPYVTSPPGDIAAQAVLRTDALYMSREWVLLVHGVATLLAPLGLTLLLLPRQPLLASAGLLFTLMEKLTELYGQTIRVFTINGVWRRQILESTDPETRAQAIESIRLFSTVWNDMFFILWSAGALAASCYALAFWKGGWRQRGLALFAAAAVCLTLPWLARDYFGYQGPLIESSWVYFIAIVGYRGFIALVLFEAYRNARTGGH
jgi:hypothetical protein